MPKYKIGEIISSKMDKTAVVKISRMIEHPIYHKKYRISKHFKAHNPENKFQEGDTVAIQECRPISKEKRWRILHKIEKNDNKEKS